MSRSWKTVARDRGITVRSVHSPSGYPRFVASTNGYACHSDSIWQAICRVMDEQDFWAQVGWI